MKSKLSLYRFIFEYIPNQEERIISGGYNDRQQVTCLARSWEEAESNLLRKARRKIAVHGREWIADVDFICDGALLEIRESKGNGE